MLVAMTDHIDRSHDKRILRGRVGEVRSWVFADDQASVFENGKRTLRKRSKAVYVQVFDDHGKPCRWKLFGVDKKGVYPIGPIRRAWFVHKGRTY